MERLYCILRFSHYFFLIHKDLYIAYHGKMTFLSTELCTLPILGIKSCCLTLVISCFILLSQPLFVLCLFEKSTEKASVQQKAFIFKIAEVPSLKTSVMPILTKCVSHWTESSHFGRKVGQSESDHIFVSGVKARNLA